MPAQPARRATPWTRVRRHASWAAVAAAALVAGTVGVAVASPERLTEVTTFVVDGGRLTGYAVDLDGDYAIFSGTLGTAAGSVVVAHRTGPSPLDWERTTLAAPAGVTTFGYGVGIDDAAGLAVVSALGVPALFVYTRTGDGTWSEPERVEIPSPLSGRTSHGNVGERLSLDGTTAAVAAPNADVGTAPSAGAVYLVDLVTRDVRTLTAAEPRSNGIFGQAVAVEGTTLAVSELQVNGPFETWPADSTTLTMFRLGRVHVVDLAQPDEPATVIDYPVTEKTKPAAATSTMPFGVSLALEGGRVYVGAPDELNFVGEPGSLVDGANSASVQDGSTTQGAVYVFDGATGAQLGGKITAPAGSFSFGATVEADGGTLLASAYNLRPDEYGQGEVYVVDLADVSTGAPDPGALSRQAPVPVQMLRPADAPDEGLFGFGRSGEGGIVLSGQTVVVGSPRLGGLGAVTVFEPVLATAPRTLTVADTSVVYGAPATLAATTDAGGPDGGRVDFAVGGVESASVTVVGHEATASLGAAVHDVGAHAVTATFLPASGASVTATGTHTVTPAVTTTSAVLSQGLHLTGAVRTQHGTVATGSVELWEGDTLLGTAALAAPRPGEGGPEQPFEADLPGAGGVTAVTYPGDGNHVRSATAVGDVVAPVPPTGVVDPAVPQPSSTSAAAAPQDGLASTGASVLGVVSAAGVLLLVGSGVVAAVRARRSS